MKQDTPESKPRDAFRGAIFRLASRVGAFQERVHDRPRGAFAALLLISVFLLAGLPRLRVDNDIDTWVATESPGAENGEQTDREFFLLIRRLTPEDTKDSLRVDRELSERVSSVRGVASVESVSGILERIGKSSLDELGEGRRFFDGYLLFDGGQVVVERVWLEPGASIEGVDTALHEIAGLHEGALSVLGPAAFNAEMDRRSRQESARILPLALLVVFLILLISLRSWRVALGVTASSVLGVVLYLGVLGWMGLSLNFLTLNVPTLAFVVLVAVTVHPLSAWIDLRGRADSRNAKTLRDCARRTFPGCFLAVVTTALGFSSLSLTAVGAIREFGLLAALSVVVVFVYGLFSFPLTLRFYRGGAPTNPPRPILRDALVETITHRSGTIRRVALVVFALSVLPLSQLSPSHDPLDFFSADDAFRRACARESEVVRGLAPLELEVHIRGEPSLSKRLERLDDVVESTERIAKLDDVFSVLEPFKLAGSILRQGSPGSYALPDNPIAFNLALAAVRAFDRGSLLSADGETFRVFLPLNLLDQEAFATVRDDVLGELNQMPGVSASARGLIQDLMTTQQAILSEQLTGFTFALLGITILVAAYFGSLRDAILTLAANLAPILLTGCVMVSLDIPLDLMTAMVASVALGLSVDDTIHMLWERHTVNRWDRQSLARLLDRVGGPIQQSSLVLVAGFATLAVSSFPPLSRFGFLVALNLLLSLFFQLVVVPAFLESNAWIRRRPPRTKRVKSTAGFTELSILVLLCLMASAPGCASNQTTRPGEDEIRDATLALCDQNGGVWPTAELLSGPGVLLLGCPESSEISTSWDVDGVLPRVRERGIPVHRILDLGEVSILLAPFVERRLRAEVKPEGVAILLDWEGRFARHYGARPKATTVLLIDRRGVVRFRVEGNPTPAKETALSDALLVLDGESADA